MAKMNQSILYTPAYLEFKAVLASSKIEDIPTLINGYMQLLKPEVQEAI
ncbi:hypothetical protein [Fluoribacter gormanii]|nr:hypothetical protein [Fluoribacter gormanii]